MDLAASADGASLYEEDEDVAAESDYFVTRIQSPPPQQPMAAVPLLRVSSGVASPSKGAASVTTQADSATGSEDDGDSHEGIVWDTAPNAVFDEVVARIIMDPVNELDLLDNVFIRREADGSTLLHVVAGWTNCHELVERLLLLGIPPDTRDTSGWTPLLEAAQEGQIQTCDVLLSHGATPDLSSGELTPLRAAAEVGNEEMTQWLLGQPGTWSGEWDQSFFSFLLAKTPGAVGAYLDRFSTVLNHSKRGYIGVCYSQLRSLYGEPHVPVEETALSLVVRSSSARDILQHRVMKYLLKAKWKSFARSKFRREFSAYVLLLVSYFVPTIWADPDWTNLQTQFDYWVATSRFVSWVCSLYLLVRVELYEFLGDSARNYFFSFWNWLNIITYIATMASIPIEFAGDAYKDARNSLLALITASLWVNLLQFLQVSTESGLLIAMMSHMVKDVYRFLLLYAVFIFGYSGAFYILLRGQAGYENFTNAFITVFLMLFGAIDYSVFSDKSIHGWLWHMGNFLLITHLVSVVIVLLNILIAMMATTYSDVWDAAEAEAMQSHAQAILRMEKSLRKGERTAKYLKLLQPPAPPHAMKKASAPKDLSVFDKLNATAAATTRDLLTTRSTTKRAINESVLSKLKVLPLAGNARAAVNRALARSTQAVVSGTSRMAKTNRSAIYPDNGESAETEKEQARPQGRIKAAIAGAGDRVASSGGAVNFIENLIEVPNLNVLEQTLFLKSAFDQDDEGFDAGPGTADGSTLATLEDGIRYELPVKKAKEHEQLAALRDLQTQVKQLTKVVTDLQAIQVATALPSSRMSGDLKRSVSKPTMRRSFYSRPAGKTSSVY